MPDGAMLMRIRRLLNEGRALDVWREVENLAPPDQWLKAGPVEGFLGSRLVSWLGNPGRASAMDRVAARRHPGHPEVFLRSLSLTGRIGGPLAMLRRILDRDSHPVLTDPQRAFMLNLEADLWSRWSDFTQAHRCLDEAGKLRPDHDREMTSRAVVLMREDRRADSLELAVEALRRQPGNTTAHWLKAELLRELGREEECRAALEAGMATVQDGDLVITLANWHAERGHWREALELSEEYAATQPLMSLAGRRGLAGWRARQHYLSGDRDAALRCAADSPKCFISEIADRLRAGHPGRRQRLDVPFVRQNNRTCGPATLTAICRFHGDPVAQVEISQDICYDGTPDHSERHWAEEKGWLVREFRVTPDTARALIDAGLPFTLTTVEPASAHLQAVTGYDTGADTLLVMEPGSSAHAEYRMKVLEDYAFSGPRGMVLAPRTPALEAALSAVALPEAELYDRLHRLQRALHGHRRQEALEELEELKQAAPDHRLRWVAERRVAAADGNPVRQLAAVEELLKLYPEQPTLLYEKLWLLAPVAGRREQQEFALRVKAAGKAPPEVDRLLAELLDDDARDWPRAERAWRKAIRGQPFQAEALSGLADFHWSGMERRKSLLLYRLAACVNHKSEGPSRSYFAASRWVGAEEKEESLRFLRDRAERYGRQSAAPAGTLSWALEQAGDGAEALRVLEEAASLRPEDGEALLAAGDAFLGAGDGEKARRFFAMAEHRVPQGMWLRRLAEDAVKAADLAAAVTHYRRLAELEPVNRSVHAELARLLAGTEGAARAVAYLEETCRELPGNMGLHSLLCEWLEGDHARRGQVLRHMLALDPADAWARRELALDLKAAGRMDEALAAAREAVEIDPNQQSSPGIMAEVLSAAGRREEAAGWLRQALERDVDYPWAITRLIELAPDTAARRLGLQWVLKQMEAQVLGGSSLERWAVEAWALLEPEEALTVLETVRKARPDLWQAWAVTATHLRDMGRMDEALAVAEEGVRRFPLLPRMWHDLSLIHSARGEAVPEQSALEQALKMSPGWSVAARRLAEVLRDLDRTKEARALLERFTGSWPMDQEALTDLIRLLQDTGDAEGARAACRRAGALFPLAAEIWRQRAALLSEDAELAALSGEARELTGKLPHCLSAWQCRAAVEAAREGHAGELGVLDEALRHLPGCWALQDRKSILLAECGRYEEALACCREEAHDVSAMPHWRAARAADILFRQGMEEQALAAMMEVAETHPDYSWATQKLMEWHDHRADWEEVLKWSDRLTRLNPRQQLPWGYRGGALLALKRREEAETALRQAVALDAGYAWAARQLLGLELERGDSRASAATVARVRGRVPVSSLAALYTGHGFADEALALCEEAVRLNSADAAGHETLGQALWKAGRRDEALEAWLQAVKLSPGRGWEAALSGKARETGKWEALLDRLRTWALEEPPSADALKAWASFAKEEPARRLEALDEALRLMPGQLEFADLKAETLAGMARYGEAEAVCRGVFPEGEAPPMLRRRLAWVLDRRGERRLAIREMEAALRQEENNPFGLQHLCDWLESEQRAEEAVKWAGALVRAAPQSASSFGYLASALLKSGGDAEAEPHLRRALRMEPEYEWAGEQLFRLRMKRQDTDSARRTLNILREHQPGAGTLLKEVELAAACGRKEEAVEATARLEADSGCTSQLLTKADQFLEKHGWLTEVRKKRLHLVTGTGDAPVGADWQGPSLSIVESWIQHEVGRGKYGVWKKFAGLAGGETILLAAWRMYLEEMGDRAHRGSSGARLWRSWRLVRVIRKHESLIRRQTETWAFALYSLTCSRRYPAARQLARGWEGMSGLAPWMLHNTAEAFDHGGNRREATRARIWALERLRPDHTTARHRLNHAFTLALEGKAMEALQLLDEANLTNLPTGSAGVSLRLTGVFAKVLALLVSTDAPVKERRRQAEQELVCGLRENGGLNGQGAPWRLTVRFLPRAVRLAAGDVRLQFRLFCLYPRFLGLTL
ncbi:MAG: tetratricopeptide repeat protein [Verrucomicrobiota bacterium]